jgi:prevent-host-death family protein
MALAASVMETGLIGAFEAKTHFAELVREVRQGRTFTVTLHGKAAAKIEPVAEHQMTRKEAIENIKEHRKWMKPVSLQEILEWRDEGRP